MARTRRSQQRPLRTLVIIFSDGETELNYFELKKREIQGNRNIRIETVPSNIKSPSQYIKHVEGYSKTHLPPLNDQDRIFCVFDVDTLTDSEIEKAQTRLESHRKLKSHLQFIHSNPDFEVWFLLHFRSLQDSLGPQEATTKLREFEKQYTKPNVREIFDNLIKNEKSALENAMKLRQHHQRNGSKLFSIRTNPYTNVDELVFFIESLRG